MSDVPLGCFLSGGIDSSIVAAAMRAAVPRGEPVMTFTIGFDDPRYDESPYAAAVARHLGTEHHHFRVKPDAAEDLPKLAAAFGEPFGDSSALPTHYLARETRRFVKVALERRRRRRAVRRLRPLPRDAAGPPDRRRCRPCGRCWRCPLWQRLPGSHPKGHLARLKRFLAPLGDEPGPALRAVHGACSTSGALADLLEPGFAGRPRSHQVPAARRRTCRGTSTSPARGDAALGCRSATTCRRHWRWTA